MKTHITAPYSKIEGILQAWNTDAADAADQMLLCYRNEPYGVLAVLVNSQASLIQPAFL